MLSHFAYPLIDGLMSYFSGKQLICCLQFLSGVSLSRGRGSTSGLGGMVFWERWDGDSVLQDVWHLWRRNASSRLPWWFSGQETACQCPRHGSSPWLGTTLHAAGHLGPCTTPAEPVLWSPQARPRRQDAAAVRSPFAATGEQPPALCNWREACAEDPAQPRINTLI